MIQKTIRLLEKVGFKMEPFDGSRKTLFGTIAAEPYSVKPDHFEPRHRSVFVSSRMSPQGGNESFFYVTSHIHGRRRGYRCKNWHENAEIGNIFATGPTQHSAVIQFLENFKTQTYNRSTPL